MTTKGFTLCAHCKERLASLKRALAVPCGAERVLGGPCNRRTTHPSRICVQHRKE
jgi:hypothetical protein